MPKGKIESIVKRERLEAVAQGFMARGISEVRLPEEYRNQPDLLTADLAWAVVAALCAAHVSGVTVDIEEAAKAGARIFSSEFEGPEPTESEHPTAH